MAKQPVPRKTAFSNKSKQAVSTAIGNLKKTYTPDIETVREGEIHLYLDQKGDYTPYKILAINDEEFFVQAISTDGDLWANKFNSNRHKFIRSNYQWGDVLRRNLDGKYFVVKKVAIQFNEYIIYGNEITDFNTADELVTNRQLILNNLADLDLVGYRDGYKL